MKAMDAKTTKLYTQSRTILYRNIIPAYFNFMDVQLNCTYLAINVMHMTKRCQYTLYYFTFEILSVVNYKLFML